MARLSTETHAVSITRDGDRHLSPNSSEQLVRGWWRGGHTVTRRGQKGGSQASECINTGTMPTGCWTNNRHNALRLLTTAKQNQELCIPATSTLPRGYTATHVRPAD